MSEIITFFGALALPTAFFAFLGYWIVWAGQDEIPLVGAWIKTAAIGLIAAVCLLESAEGAIHWGRLSSFDLITLALLLSACGDFALARRGQRVFLLGLSAFALAHLSYATGFWLRSRAIIASDNTYDKSLHFSGGTVTSGQIAALVALAALLLSTELWLTPRAGALRWPVRCYVLAIGTMAASAILLLDNTGAAMLRLGAALFVASDVLLALRLFIVTDQRWRTRLSLTLWPAYWIGQMLIIFGATIYWIHPKG